MQIALESVLIFNKWFLSCFDLIFAYFSSDKGYHLRSVYLYNNGEDRWAAVRSSRGWRWHPLRSGQCLHCTNTPVMQDVTNHRWHQWKQGTMSKAKSVTHCSLWSAGHVICTNTLFLLLSLLWSNTVMMMTSTSSSLLLTTKQLFLFDSKLLHVRADVQLSLSFFLFRV